MWIGKKLFEITKTGQDLLAKIGFTVKQPGGQGIEHRYFLEKIRQLYIQTGWVTFLEKDDIDLVVEKTDETIAIECETGTNNTEQVIKNFEKLIHCNAGKKMIVATNEIAYNKTQKIFSDLKLSGKNALQIFMARDLIKSIPCKS